MWKREFDALPSLRRSLLYAAFRRKPGLQDGQELGHFEASIASLPLDPSHLERYRAVCQSVAEVPITFPQLLATHLHVAMLIAPEFPIPAMGLVHPRVRMIQHRPLAPGERIALRCFISGQRPVKNGVEFDMETEVRAGDELVWESSAATFSRRRSRSGEPGANTGENSPAEVSAWPHAQAIELPAGAGRRYAAVSGDYNPVHLHPWLARLFGYRRPIAHGWWLLARCLGALARDGAAQKTTVEARLLRPVFLPSTLELCSRSDDESVAFSLRDPGDSGKPRVVGSITAL